MKLTPLLAPRFWALSAVRLGARDENPTAPPAARVATTEGAELKALPARRVRSFGDVEGPISTRAAGPSGSAEAVRGSGPAHGLSAVATARTETAHVDRDAEPTGVEGQPYGAPAVFTPVVVEHLMEEGGRVGGAVDQTDLFPFPAEAGRVAVPRS